MRVLYLMLLPGIALAFVFKYLPIYGVLMAFTDYHYVKGILGSPWNDFAYFKLFSQDPFFGRVLRNTIIIRVYQLVFAFGAPIVFALLLNEIRNTAFKKTIQTVSYLPHFGSLGGAGIAGPAALQSDLRSHAVAVRAVRGRRGVSVTYAPTFGCC